MKVLSLKSIGAIFTLFISVGLVSLWYFSRIGLVNQQTLSDASLSVTPVMPVFENPCDYPQPQNRELEPDEVIHLAECFIIQNGYTDLPPTTDKSKLTPENVFPGTDEQGLKMRHDSLERKAFSYRRSEIYDGSWMVMFRYKPNPDIVKFYGDRLNYSGRAVTMDYYGNRLRVQHSDYPLETPEAKIINP